MNTRLQTAIALGLLGLSTLAVTHTAQACGINNRLPFSALPRWQLPANLPKGVSSTAAALSPEFAVNPLKFLEPLTGMYSVTFTAEGNAPPGPPDGTVIDQAYVTWHADGTELMNSQSAKGGLCMGVWKQTGTRTYTLNHFALPYDPVTGAFIGPLNVREDLTWARDYNSYTGNATYTQYAPDGITVIPPIVYAAISGTRIKP